MIKSNVKCKIYISKSRRKRIEKTEKILDSIILRGMRLLGLLGLARFQIVDSSDVILQIRFSVGTVFEYLATILAVDVPPFLLLVTVGVVVLQDVTGQEFLITISAAESQVLTFNFRLEGVYLLCSFVNILLVCLELGGVSELNVTKPAEGLPLNVSLSGVEPESVGADKPEVTQLTEIFQHVLLDPLARQECPLLRLVFLHVGAQVERLLERLIAKRTLD